ILINKYLSIINITEPTKHHTIAKAINTIKSAALGAILIGIAWTVSSYILHVAEVVG
ncbi:MAG: hypothetical protein HY564_02915, partial [Candidatus Jacksonbacteria bacterium]|nr:hypothetical protein [Candidatus Jacksonbacteria bacterium]